MANSSAMKSALLRIILLSICCLSIVPAYSQDYFRGTITYSVSAKGEPQAAKLFTDSQSDTISVSWSEKGFEQREKKGWNQGKIIYVFDSDTAIYCNQRDQKNIKAAVQDLDKTDPEVKAFLVNLFTYQLNATGETQTIAGYESEEFEVIKSGFLKANAKARVWITKDLKLSPSQYKFETEWKMILAALPLQYGFKEGAVLKAEIEEPSYIGEGTVIVSYEVSKIQKDIYPNEFLEVPSNYSE